jgi:hypothetical protein
LLEDRVGADGIEMRQASGHRGSGLRGAVAVVGRRRGAARVLGAFRLAQPITLALNGNNLRMMGEPIMAALKASFAACDKVFAATTDANATAPVDFFGQKQTRLGMLAFTNSHMWEHYGNLVTYMRLKNIVPPSSER